MNLLSAFFPVIVGAVASFSMLNSRSSANVTSSPIETVSGYAKVTDGDSLRIGEHRIRLFGIDAMEGRQMCQFGRMEWACGRSSRKALEQQVKSRRITCDVIDTDRYARLVSICYAGRTDLNEAQVRNGWAVAYITYSSQYLDAEQDARLNSRGIWRAEFERPEDYRRRLRQVSEADAKLTFEGQPHSSCLIKGNISSGSGGRIYHIPGQRDYERTRIDVKKDERWFCTEAEAIDAGWRKAYR